jgi:hypothetical protein
MTQAVAETKDFTEVEVCEMVARYAELRDQAAWFESFQRSVGNTIKEWLGSHGGTLQDHERGNIARLQIRTGSPELDVPAIALREPGLLVDLARNGCLKLDFPVFRETAALQARVKKYLVPGRTTAALSVTTRADEERRTSAQHQASTR